MKNYLMLLLVFVFISCSSDPKELIAKKWEMDKKDVEKEIEKIWEKENDQEEETQELKARLSNFIEMLGKTTLKINADGNYAFTSMGHEQHGKWTIDEKGTLLVLVDNTGEKNKINIKELTKKKLVIEYPDEDFPSMTFKPVKEE